VSWTGVLLPSRTPVPRTLKTSLRSPFPFAVPDAVFVRSFSPEGGPLQPVFEPTTDPNVNAQNTVLLAGTADAPYTNLRPARRRGTCQGGPLDGNRCESRTDCAGQACAASCLGDATIACTSDNACGSDGPCGRLYDAFVPGPGPVTLPRAQVTSPVA